MIDTWTCHTQSPDQTASIGRLVGEHCKAGDLIALIGELGAGKTQFTRGLAQGMGVANDQVSSPTFVLVHEYHGPPDRPQLIHMDAYRVGSLDELESIGWDPASGGGELREHCVLVVEWADRLGGTLGHDMLEITIEHVDQNERQVGLRFIGKWASRGPSLLAALTQLQSTFPHPKA